MPQALPEHRRTGEQGPWENVAESAGIRTGGETGEGPGGEPVPISEIHIGERASVAAGPATSSPRPASTTTDRRTWRCGSWRPRPRRGRTPSSSRPSRPPSLATAAAPKAACQQQTTDPAESQRDMLASLELSRDAHAPIRRRCSGPGHRVPLHAVRRGERRLPRGAGRGRVQGPLR